MAKLRSIKVGVINIKTQPHSKNGYIRLLETTFGLERPGKVRGFDWGIIGSLRKKEDKEIGPIVYGTIFRFLNIDPEGVWLDLKKLNTVGDEDERIPQIPPNLKPNVRQFLYVFVVKKHRMLFEANVITPGSMVKLIRALFSEEEIFENFGEVDVVAESTQEAIRKILKIEQITKLSIDFTIPNADELNSLQERYIRRLEGENVRRHQQTSTSTSKDGINPNKETVSIMELAASNGEVSATGYSGESRVVYSTKDHPMIEKFSYNPEIESRLGTMLYASTKMLRGR